MDFTYNPIRLQLPSLPVIPCPVPTPVLCVHRDHTKRLNALLDLSITRWPISRESRVPSLASNKDESVSVFQGILTTYSLQRQTADPCKRSIRVVPCFETPASHPGQIKREKNKNNDQAVSPALNPLNPTNNANNQPVVA